MSLNIKPMLFGTSGIRGVLGRDISLKTIRRATAAYIRAFKVSRCVVGRDNRAQSLLLHNTVVEALLSYGVHVLDVDVAPTPAISRLVRELNADGGVSVTGSHTPPYIAGVLYFYKDTGELDWKQTASVESLFDKINELSPSGWRNLGSVEHVHDAREIYVKSVKRDLGRIQNSKGPILFDFGNGAMGPYASELIRDYGLDLVPVNYDPIYDFPSRLPSPIPLHLAETAKHVRNVKPYLAVATDSDGDRAIFITKNGTVLPGDVTGAIFARVEAVSGVKKFAVTVNTSDVACDTIKKAGGRCIITKVGPPAIVEAIRRDPNVGFALEESGKYIWRRFTLYGDSAISVLMMYRLFDDWEAELASLPKYYVIKREVRVAEAEKEAIMDAVKSMLGDAKRLITIDGLKAYYAKHSWLLIRPSGTEPLIRVFAHAGKSREALEFARRGVQMVKDARRSLSNAYKNT